MEFLYTDDKLAVCVKEPGVLSTDEPGGVPSLVRAAIGGSAYTVHRLDRVTGGVLVVARTRHAASDLGKAVRDGKFQKEYLAVITGRLPEREGRLCDLLFRDTARRRTLVVDAPGKDVLPAELTYTVLREREECSLVRVRLVTGRTHQIRAQFAHRGHPLLGDVKYGAAEGAGVALWSASVSFPHPRSGEILRFSALPPAELPWTLFGENQL